MKTIILHIEEDVIKALRSHLTVKLLAQSFGGISDQALNKIIEAIEKDQSEFTLKFKEGAEY